MNIFFVSVRTSLSRLPPPLLRFVSHEIRTPINTITLGLQLLASQLITLAPAAQAQVQAQAQSQAHTSFRAAASSLATVVDSPPGSFRSSSEHEASTSTSTSMHRPRGRQPSASKGTTDTVAECLQLVGELTESSKTAVVVLNELINYDKIEMQKFHVERRVCDLYGVLLDTLRPLEAQAKQRKVQLQMKVCTAHCMCVCMYVTVCVRVPVHHTVFMCVPLYYAPFRAPPSPLVVFLPCLFCYACWVLLGLLRSTERS